MRLTFEFVSKADCFPQNGVCMLSHSVMSDTMDFIAQQAPLPMGSSMQEYWSGLPWLPLGYLLDPWIEPAFLMSPALAGRFFTTRAICDAQCGNVHPII